MANSQANNVKVQGTADESVSRFLEAWLGARQLIQAANFNRFQKAGLSATQFMTLNLIPENGNGMTLSELAKRLNLAVATVGKTLDSLETRGLLIRTRSAQDRRSILLSLTEDGRKLHNAASAEFHSHMAALFYRLSAKQREGLVSGLEALLSLSANATDADDVAPPARSSPQSRKR